MPKLNNKEHGIESLSGVKEGSKIYIIYDPLKGWESIVKGVNRHKRQAWTEIEFMGSIKLVCIALEIVEKVE